MSNPIKEAGIEHVVVLMLENRGFDHVLGWLYEASESPNINSTLDDNRGFMGLSTVKDLKSLANVNPFNSEEPIPPIKGARSPATPEFNPGEHFVHIMSHVWGVVPEDKSEWEDSDQRKALISKQFKQHQRVPMSGFMIDYKKEIEHATSVTPTVDNTKQILETYLPEQLPVLNGLAKHYAVSDEWFCSVPSQTNTNRAFSTAGTSRGLVTNNYYDLAKQPGINVKRLKPFTAIAGGDSHADRLPETTQSLFGLLSNFDKDWKLYWQSTWPPTNTIAHKLTTAWMKVQYVRGMFPELVGSAYDKNFVQIDPIDPKNALFEDALKGKLPAVTWIEPKWGGGANFSDGFPKRLVGTDMHPACDTTVAEEFILNLYNALSQSEKWDKTLFLLTFDENGGTYDHIPPFCSNPQNKEKAPAAAPSGLDRTPPPGPYGGSMKMDPKTRTEFGFEFDEFGIRVPTLLISPKLKINTVFRSKTKIPFDHTSIISTILDWQEIDRKYWFLGDRVNSAPTFSYLFENTVDRTQDTNFSQSIVRKAVVTENVASSTDYYLRYLGNPWGTPLNPPLYLGAPEWSKKGPGYYPTTTNELKKAAKIQIQPNSNKDLVVNNMGKVRIKYSSPPTYAKISFPNIAVTDNLSSYAFCTRSSFQPYYDEWEIRLMGSRSPMDIIKTGDWVCFISTGYTKLDNTRFDPFQRLCPESGYLSTQAGIWGVWELTKL